MKGIILAGGKGTRLHPVTKAVNKHLLPIYDKPMIYYPLSVLMLAGIREVLIITTPEAIPAFKELLGDGSDIGMRLDYCIQEEPNGLAEAFILGEEFLAGQGAALILGDNLFFGHGLPTLLGRAAGRQKGGSIFAYAVKDPKRFGVLKLDREKRPVAVIEKPDVPPSNWAVTGLYFFDGGVPEVAKAVKPSARGELEITDVIQAYMDKGAMEVEYLGRGHAWMDMGTHESFLHAAGFIGTVEERQALKISCLEEIAFRMGFIDFAAFKDLAKAHPDTTYGAYLRLLVTMEEVEG
ncbi:MAG: glucose-1-phosphate thymidylyltransferase RfbA [Rhodospirillales bacterium]